MRRTPRSERGETEADRTTRLPPGLLRRAGPLIGLAGTAGLLVVVLMMAVPLPSALGAGSAVAAASHSGPTPAVLAPAKWTKLSPTTSPPPRQSGSMVYDAAAKEMVLFGGYSGGPLGDTWTYASGVWTDRTSANVSQPSARWYFGLAYDPAADGVVMFGGRNLYSDLNDTWVFNGTAWSQVTTVVAPPPMTTSRMVYDARAGAVVLYGGDSIMPGTPGFYNVVWEFRAGAWKNTTAHVRGIPSNPNLLTDGVYDPATGAIFYFGGDGMNGGTCTAPGYTWSYSNGTFTNLSATSGKAPPLAAGSRMMAYDPAIRGIVLYGGWDDGSCAYSHATYEYSSGTWSRIALPHNPGPLWDGDMATDTANGNVILFSGNTAPYTSSQSTETWRFTP